MGRKLYLLLAAVVAILVAGWFMWPRKAGEPPASQKTKVTIAQVGDFFIYMPLYYAQQKGFFDRHGLSVRIINSGGDEKSVAAVVAGGADFGVGDPTFAAVAHERGQDVRVVASVVDGVPFWGITKRTDLKPIVSPSELKGLTVATFPAPSTAYALQEQMFKEGGLTPSIKQAQFGSLLPLLDAGDADVVLELEPNVSTAVAHGAHILYSFAAKYPQFAITGVTVAGATLERRPDVVKRFVTALNEAEQDAHKHPADVVAFAKSRFPQVPPDIAAAAAMRMLDANVFPRSTDVSLGGWRQAVALRVANGDLKRPAEADALLFNAHAR